MNTGFNEDQLSDNEKAYLGSVMANDVIQLRGILEDLESNTTFFNYDCQDFRGRSALHLAVENENVEIIEMLIDRTSYPCLEEALLHAINKDCVKTIRAIIEHPSFMAKCHDSKKHSRRACVDEDDDDDDEFPHDVTPLTLAAQRNNHEVIQMFLSRNFTIEKPHWVSCTCAECSNDREKDSLKRSRSRLNAYKALVSPAYMALSSPDPIMTTFELRQEMKKLAQVEKEFKNEYTSLVEQCMDFACELMDLCRGTQEVEAVLSDHVPGSVPDPLARLKMALKYDEKKFVAHPNCQQHLTSVWYGTEMGFLQSMSPWKQVLFWILGIPVVPLLCLLYLACPDSKVARMLKCPASKFIAHTMSNLFFLLLISMATFSTYQHYPSGVLPQGGELPGERREITKDRESLYYLTSCEHLHLFDQWNSNYLTRDRPRGEEEGTEDDLSDELELLLSNTLRSCNVLLTKVHICLLVYVLGMMCTECRQLYVGGLNNYLMDNYNWIDFIVLSLYLSSYALRLLVNVKVASADWFFGGAASRARRVLLSRDLESFRGIVVETCNKSVSPTDSYFMRASRFEWQMNDPEIISDMLFGLANVWSIARTTYLMPAFEVLGPLQISLGRMMADITRFLVLFALVLLAFMVGLHNLYCYYGGQTFKVISNGTTKLMHSSEAFKDLWRTLLSLFWSMFGLVSLESIEIKHPHLSLVDGNHSYWHDNLSFQVHPLLSSSSSSSFSSSSSSSPTIQLQSLPGLIERPNSTVVVEGVGLFLFALYHVTVIVVLINMLIAMMSHSFEAIQGDCDVEWKFARTNLWMNYIRVGDTLPIPFNMLPSVKTFSSLFHSVRSFFLSRADNSKVDDDDDVDDEECAACVFQKKSRCLGNLQRRFCSCCRCYCCCGAEKNIYDDEDDDDIEGEEKREDDDYDEEKTTSGFNGSKGTDCNCSLFCLGGQFSRTTTGGNNNHNSKYKQLESGSSCSTWCCFSRKQIVEDDDEDEDEDNDDDDDDDDDDDGGGNKLKAKNVVIINNEALGHGDKEDDNDNADNDDDDDDNDDGQVSQKRVHFIPHRSLDRENRRHHHHHQHQHGKRHGQSSNADILQRLVRRYLFKLERIKDEAAKDVGNSVSETCFVTDYLKERKDSAFQDIKRKPLSSHGSNQSLALNFPPSTSLASGAVVHKSIGTRKNRPQSMRRRHQQYYQVQLPPDSLTTEQTTELHAVPKSRPFQKQRTSEQLPVVNEPTKKATKVKRSSFSPSTPSPSPTPHSPLSPTTTLHLMSLPKIDAIVRSIKNFQAKVALVGNATLKKEAVRDDIRHVEKLLVENCKALSSVLLVLKSVHTEVETLKTLTSLNGKKVLL